MSFEFQLAMTVVILFVLGVLHAVFSVWAVLCGCNATVSLEKSRNNGSIANYSQWVIGELNQCVVKKQCPAQDDWWHRVADRIQWVALYPFRKFPKVVVASQWLRAFVSVFIIFPMIIDLWSELRKKRLAA
jgi:hypothetical protein